MHRNFWTSVLACSWASILGQTINAQAKHFYQNKQKEDSVSSTADDKEDLVDMSGILRFDNFLVDRGVVLVD